MAGQTQTQNKINMKNENPVFSIKIEPANEKLFKISDASEYFILVDLSEPANSIEDILSNVERVRIYMREHGRSVEILAFSYSSASILVGKNEYLSINIDFGDNAPPLDIYLKDLLEGRISIKQYYKQVLGYILEYIEEIIKNIKNEE